MDGLIYQPIGNSQMNEPSIEFMADEWFDRHRRKIVWFSVIVDHKTLECAISIEALCDHSLRLNRHVQPAFRSSSPHATNYAAGGARSPTCRSRSICRSRSQVFWPSMAASHLRMRFTRLISAATMYAMRSV
jgi:hypothetical protein